MTVNKISNEESAQRAILAIESMRKVANDQMKIIRTRQCQQLFKFHVSRSTLCELFLGRDSILSCGDSVVKPNGSCNMKSG